MRIVVTGGSGRIGSFVVRELLARGHEVTNLDRRHSREPAGRFVFGNAGDRALVQPLLENADAVCHLGEIPNVNAGRSPEEVHAENVRAGSVIMQTAADLKLKRLIYTSSCQVYGLWSGSATRPRSLPFDETQPVFPHNAYALSKVANEMYAQLVSRQQGLSVAVFRLPWTIVEEFSEAWVDNLRRPPQSTDGFATYVHASDVACGFALALEHPRPGFEVYHFSAREILSLQPLRDRLREHHPDFPPLPSDWPAFKSPVLTDKLGGHFGWEAKWDFLDLYRQRHGEPGKQ